MKTVSRYEIRYYPTPTSYSNRIGFKGRLYAYRDSVKIVRKLKKMGVDAFYAKLVVSA